MGRKVLSLLVITAFLVTSMLSGVVLAADESTFYTKIQELSTEEKAALVGIFWTGIKGYSGNSTSTTDQIVNSILNDLNAIGLGQKLSSKGITESVIRSTITSIKSNAPAVKAIVDLQKLTSSSEMDKVLSQLVSSGIINSSVKSLASANMIAMLDAFELVNRPILTKNESGSIIVKTENLDLLVTIANTIIASGSGTTKEQFTGLAGDIASALNEISNASQRNNLISVLKSFKIYEEPVTTTTPPTGGPIGPGPIPPVTTNDSATQGQKNLDAAVNNAPVVTAEVVTKITEAVTAIVKAVPKSEEEAGTVSKAISNASGNLVQAMDKAANDTIKNQIAKDTAKLVGAAADSIAAAKTESKAVEIINNAAATLSNAGSVANGVKDNASREAIIDSTKTVVSSVAKAMDVITNSQKALEVVNSIIDNTSKLLSPKENAKSVNEETLVKELAKVAEKALEKVGKEVVASQYSGATLKSVVSDEQLTNLIQKAADVKSNAASLENKIGQNVETKLTIEVQKKDEAKDIQVQLPAKLMDTVKAQGIDKMEINTGLASVGIAPDTIKAAGTSSISLSVKSVEANGLTPAQKFKVGNGKVFDFSLSVDNKEVKNFDKAVMIKVPYELSEGENPEKITVEYVDENGKTENMAGKYDPQTKTVVFSTNHFSTYVVKANEVKFNDLEGFEWAQNQIEVMAAKGAIGGMIPSFYAPDNNVTRAQFASIIVKALNLFDANAKADFNDVAEGDWYYSAVASAVKAGIIAGYPDKTFKPDANITRQDMAVMAANAMKKYKGAIAPQDLAQALNFADAGSIADYAKAGAAIATKYDIITGMPDKKFAPAENANRAQAAVIIYKIFNMK